MSFIAKHKMDNEDKLVKVTVFYIHLYKIYSESYIILTGNLTLIKYYLKH